MFTVGQSLNCLRALAVNGGFLGLWFHKHFLTGVQTLHRKVMLSKTRINFSVTLLKTLRNHLGPSPGVFGTEAEAFQVSKGTSSGLLFAHRARYGALDGDQDPCGPWAAALHSSRRTRPGRRRRVSLLAPVSCSLQLCR